MNNVLVVYIVFCAGLTIIFVRGIREFCAHSEAIVFRNLNLKMKRLLALMVVVTFCVDNVIYGFNVGVGNFGKRRVEKV